jgi:O-antigen/teichoic acid export membrane protein
MAARVRPPAFLPGKLPVPALLLTPAFLIFVSSNFVNAGNLLFNTLFSRWMGPALYGDLALILTLKLAILGVFAALQMAVSREVAQVDGDVRDRLKANLARMNKVLFLALWLCLPFALVISIGADLGATFGLSNSNLFIIILLSVPFVAPLSICRGVAFGELCSWQIIISANAEMLVRLVGAIVVWHLGFGIEGVVVALSLSVVAGWLGVARALPKPPAGVRQARQIAIGVALGALPFAALQIAQVLSLDGDIFLAKARLEAEQAGYLAALSLFQRIQFFACFALAGTLLAAVVAAAREGKGILAAAMPVVCLFLLVSVVVLSLAIFRGDLVVRVLVGPEFGGAVQGLIMAACASIAFTASYLLATLLSALKDQRGIWAALAVSILQLVWMAFATLGPELSFLTLLEIKMWSQLGLAGLLLIMAVQTVLKQAYQQGW